MTDFEQEAFDLGVAVGQLRNLNRNEPNIINPYLILGFRRSIDFTHVYVRVLVFTSSNAADPNSYIYDWLAEFVAIDQLLA